jgi:hypothetical protein
MSAKQALGVRGKSNALLSKCVRARPYEGRLRVLAVAAYRTEEP